MNGRWEAFEPTRYSLCGDHSVAGICRLTLSGCRRKRQREGDSGAPTAAVFGPDRASVSLDQAPRDRQAEARAATGTGSRYVLAPEAVEHALGRSRRETGAGVLDRDDHVIGVRPH